MIRGQLSGCLLDDLDQSREDHPLRRDGIVTIYRPRSHTQQDIYLPRWPAIITFLGGTYADRVDPQGLVNSSEASNIR